MKTLSVLILTQESCDFCDDAKAILDRLSREYALSVSTMSLESVAGQALAQKAGILFPPGIFFDGEPCCFGRPSERRLRREIEQRLAANRIG